MCDQNPLLDHLIHVIPVLTDDEVNQWVEHVIKHLAQHAGASLRG